MTRKFIATVLAAAVALSGLTAAPARATENDALLRVLGIGATLLVVGAAIKNAKDDKDDKKKKKKKKKKQQAQHVAPTPRATVPEHGYRRDWNGYGDRGRHDTRGRYVDRGRHDTRGRYEDRGRHDFGRARSPLPARCLIQTRNGAHAFGAKCLQNRYDQARRLPDACRTTERNARGKFAAFDARCLRRNGYEIARR